MIDLPAFDALALSLHHSPGVHAILVGSGLSRAAGIPTGWEITLDLVRRLAVLDGVTEQADWAQWYLAKYGKEPNYSELLHTLAKTTSERRTILQSYIDPREGEDIRKPTKAHHAIARLAASNIVRVVITTNFDRLIENAMREAGVEPTIIAGDDAIVGATPLVHTKCMVIKVHGDYLDARIKNTDAELEAYSRAMNGLLDQVFDNFGLLVVGWSGEWDTALRDAIQRAPSRRYPFYWAARGATGSAAQDLIDAARRAKLPDCGRGQLFRETSRDAGGPAASVSPASAERRNGNRVGEALLPRRQIRDGMGRVPARRGRKDPALCDRPRLPDHSPIQRYAEWNCRCVHGSNRNPAQGVPDLRPMGHARG